MDLLTEIRKLKQRQNKATAEEVENPLPHFEMIFKQIEEKRREVMIQQRVSWAELLDGAARVAPALTELVIRLSEEIDTDIYGRYVDGTLTQQELEAFYEKLDQWKRLSLKLFQLFSAHRSRK